MAFGRRKSKDDDAQKSVTPVVGKFDNLKAKIKEMYKDDQALSNRTNGQNTQPSVQFANLTPETFLTRFFQAAKQLPDIRNYSKQAYATFPLYESIIQYLSNMYCWRYTYTPVLVKDKGGDYAEIYQLMSSVISGISIETTFPQILTQLFVDGAVYLITVKNTSSQTLSTLILPSEYCRPTASTQYGTMQYQFDYSYFTDLGLQDEQLTIALEMFPKEMQQQYQAYVKDTKNMRWQVLNPRFSAAIMGNDYGVPTRLYSLYGILQHQNYLSNELERNSQLLDKIISHKLPTWQNQLIVDLDEMSALHKSMAKVLTKNSHVRLLSSFGDIQVQSIGQDQAKENKTLENSYNSIFSTTGLNYNLFDGSGTNALQYSLIRDKTYVWKYVNQLVKFYNLALNNSFNFKGYQCEINMLPITHYDEERKLLEYKEGATLGVSKLEYIVASGVKQQNIAAKIELEDFLKLDQLKPLSTSYTQNDNSKKDNPEDKDEEKNPNKEDENEDEDSNKDNNSPVDDESAEDKKEEVKQDE